jgi:hypothetical protein
MQGRRMAAACLCGSIDVRMSAYGESHKLLLFFTLTAMFKNQSYPIVWVWSVVSIILQDYGA